MSIPVQQVQQAITEWRALEMELKRLRKMIQSLRQQKSQKEQLILTYIEQTGHPGIKCQGLTLVAHPRQKRAVQTKVEKRERARRILQERGIADSEEALSELLEAMRGPPQMHSVLKLM
jgi:hypothetical protein